MVQEPTTLETISTIRKTKTTPSKGSKNAKKISINRLINKTKSHATRERENRVHGEENTMN